MPQAGCVMQITVSKDSDFFPSDISISKCVAF